MGSKEEHERIVRETLIILGAKAHKYCRVWRNETGAAYRGDKLIHYGLKGSADITGILHDGVRLELEVKSGRATQQENQQNFERMITTFRGVYRVIHNAQEALDYILNYCKDP